MEFRQSNRAIVWFTGLSGAGKTTLANTLAERLRPGTPAVVLDGDECRSSLCSDLGFSREDRLENVRRIGCVACLVAANDLVVLVAAISPYAASRYQVRESAGRYGIPFIEVFVDAPLDVVMRRDVKGLYGQANKGSIQGMTGLSDPYEPPCSPELQVNTDKVDVETCVSTILSRLMRVLHA